MSSTRTVIRPNETKLGKVLSSNGLTLYGLTTDTSESSTCIGPCFVTWPPVSLPDASVPAGLDPKRFGVITRADGLHQLKIGRRPLFRFVGDAQPGDVNGQGVGGVWFAVDPGGELQR